VRTVKEMIIELKKFPLDSKCFAYEGESIGVSVMLGKKIGFIHCREGNCKENDTETFENNCVKKT
jgi:hypothetical protein